MLNDGIVTAVRLLEPQYRMLIELQEELRMSQVDLIELAVTQLWVEVQLKKAAARIK